MRVNRSEQSYQVLSVFIFICLQTCAFAQRVGVNLNKENIYENYSMIFYKTNNNQKIYNLGEVFDDPDLKQKSKNFNCRIDNCTIDDESFAIKDLLVMGKYEFLVKNDNDVFLEWRWEKGKVGSFEYNKKKYYFEIGHFGDEYLSTFTDKKLILKEIGDLKIYDDFVNKFESCIKMKDLKCVEGLVYDTGNNIVNYKLDLNDQVALATVKMTKEGCEKIKQYAENKYHKPISMFDGENNVQPEMLKNNYDKNVVFIKFESMLRRIKNKDINYLSFSKDEHEPFVNIVDNQADKKLNCEDSFNYDIVIKKRKGQWYFGYIQLVVNYLE